MNQWRNLANIRREYGDLPLNEADIHPCPIQQFQIWFSEILKTEIYDPNAMVLATVDSQGHPDSRVVLLKGIDEGAFVFYSNYNSVKAQQIRSNAFVALNFYWPIMSRQVRVRGTTEYISKIKSDAYFNSRPLESQRSAFISPQSAEISSRAELETALESLRESNQTPIVRPEHWGGYRVIPVEIEFWQGRDNRLHDRIQYILRNRAWSFRRLAP